MKHLRITVAGISYDVTVERLDSLESAAPTSPAFGDSVALSNDLIQGRFGLTTDLLYGFGYQGRAEQAGSHKNIHQSDVIALNIIPSYFIADGLQLVGRLQLATSSEPNGLGLQSRYEAVAPSTDKKGNTYASVYAGLNYYIYGNKLKLMNGVEYSHLGGGDYDGTTFFTGMRMAF
jgi:phosphate-selective porin OprO/OprP